MRSRIGFVVLSAALLRAAVMVGQTAAGLLPVVGSVHGAFGSNFKTSLQLVNVRQRPMSGQLLFHPAGTTDSLNDAELAWSLDPGATLGYADIVAAMGRTGLGNLLVSYQGTGVPVPGDPAPVIVARIYNEAEDGATSGCNEDSVLDVRGGLGTLTIGVLAGPIDVTRYRFNVGIANVGAFALPVRIDVRDSSGTVVHTVTRQFPPGLFEQVPVRDLLEGFEIGDDFSLNFQYGGGFVIYGATVDNQTNSPSIQIMPLVLVTG